MCDELEKPVPSGPPPKRSETLRGRGFAAVLGGAIVLLAAGIVAIWAGGPLLALVGIILVFWGLGALGALLRLNRDGRNDRQN